MFEVESTNDFYILAEIPESIPDEDLSDPSLLKNRWSIIRMLISYYGKWKLTSINSSYFFGAINLASRQNTHNHHDFEKVKW